MNIKICGLTQLVDAYLALELGAWALGFVFFPPSPRAIAPLKAAEIIEQLPPDVKTVGVFVNSSLAEMEEIAEISGISTFQLHGTESPELCQQLSLPVIKAFRLREEKDLQDLEAYKGVGLEALLIDAAVKDVWGGSGQMANWELTGQVKRFAPLILAGGINAVNASLAIEQVQPDAIDLSSGVELSPGIKDHKKLQTLFNTVKLKEKMTE